MFGRGIVERLIFKLANLIDVSITSPSTNDVLTWNGTEWVNQAGGGGSGITFTDGTHTVSAATKLTVSGGTVGGTSPNATLTITGGSGTPGGSSGQVQYNNAGAFGGFTVSGDGTLNTSTGALTVTKSNGTAFGTAAFDNTGTSGATIPLLNAANTWSGTQTFDSGDLILAGSTSGTLTVKPAAVAGTGSVITLPGGTTDFSATGGASQVVKQTSAGAAFTVGTLSNSDVGLGNVTNDTQTKAAVVPNTAPSSGQVLVGNAGGTAYAPQTLSGSGATISLSSSGVLLISAIANGTLSNSAVTVTAGTGLTGGGSVSLGASTTLSLAAIADGDILANISGASAAPSANTLTAIIDHAIGNTQGDVLYRSATAWAVLAPGTSGQVLTTGGTAANPSWTTVSGTGTVTSITAGTGLTGGTITTSGTIAVESNLMTRNICCTFDGQGSALTSGKIVYLSNIPFSGTITGVTLLADQSGSATVDIWKAAYASAPPTVSNTIVASDAPTLSTAQKSNDTTLTGWTKTITAGDTMAFKLTSATTITELSLTLQVTCS